jgi:hypothetical protein
MNILTDELQPKSFGEYVDSLIITNIRMWHEQEKIYEMKTLRKMRKNEMFDFLKKATWLNLQRNVSIDGLDGTLAAKVMERNPDIKRKDLPISMKGESLIWEQV